MGFSAHEPDVPIRGNEMVFNEVEYEEYRKTLKWKKPYGTVCGLCSHRYEQDNMLFDNNGAEIFTPARKQEILGYLLVEANKEPEVEIILTKTNNPYKSEALAKKAIIMKGLDPDLYTVTPYSNGFAITNDS